MKQALLWLRFKGRKRGTLRYYHLVQALRGAGSSPVVEELHRVVREIERVARARHRLSR